ncbi:hypothetical protein TNCV_143091 [Trichonephila clavipes]|nr:hypothetical protein TNCV_143091 [Trichonephila clavipes]
MGKSPKNMVSQITFSCYNIIRQTNNEPDEVSGKTNAGKYIYCQNALIALCCYSKFSWSCFVKYWKQQSWTYDSCCELNVVNLLHGLHTPEPQLFGFLLLKPPEITCARYAGF